MIRKILLFSLFLFPHAIYSMDDTQIELFKSTWDVIEQNQLEELTKILENFDLSQETKDQLLLKGSLCNIEQTAWAEILLSFGANINFANQTGTTALFFAIENARPDLVELFILKHHANMHSLRKSDYFTPINFSKEYLDMSLAVRDNIEANTKIYQTFLVKQALEALENNNQELLAELTAESAKYKMPVINFIIENFENWQTLLVEIIKRAA